MLARMFIVARPHPELYEYLRARFGDDATTTVVLDRRLAARRRRALPAAAERRRAERRSRPEVDERLRATSLAIVIAPSPTAPSATASLGDARQWVEAIQSCLASIHGALDDHDRLQREARAITQENERLRAEMDRSRKEVGELDSTVARALAIVNDLRARLRGGPRQDPLS